MPVKKCECGLSYVPGHPEDEIKHEKWHSEYVNGPEIPVVKDLSSIATIDSLSVSIVDRRYPVETRRELAYVASIAKRSMPDYPSGYDGTVDEDDQRLYLVADGERIVAMVVTGLDDFFGSVVGMKLVHSNSGINRQRNAEIIKLQECGLHLRIKEKV